MNFNENSRKELKIMEKSRGNTYKNLKNIHISLDNCPRVPNLISE